MTDKEKELIEKVALTHGYSYEEVNYHFQKLKETFTCVLVEAFGVIKEMIRTVYDYITVRQAKNKHNYNWHVPLDTTRLSQVRVPNVKLPRIRNLI